MASSEIDACRLMFIVPRSPKKNTSATSTQRGVDSGSNIITTTVQARIAKDILMTRAVEPILSPIHPPRGAEMMRNPYWRNTATMPENATVVPRTAVKYGVKYDRETWNE